MFRPDPRREAKRHIQRIRQEFGISTGNGTTRHVRALERALEILSDQLYQSSTHFLMELMQNADDNEYDVASPCLTLTYGDGRLRVHCNERGFFEPNVEAICRIGESTKKGKKDGKTGYIGEKGIGFKSVFKVADKVHISSGAYNFHFDKTTSLGMIAPIWDDSQTSPEIGTLMTLELSPDCDEHELKRELSSLDPRMLIFLRKLRHIKVEFVKNGVVTWKSELKRVDGLVHNEPAVQLLRGNEVMRYVVSTHTVRNLPEDARRPEVRESDIVLAFPVVQAGDPPLTTEKAYAFLPIRDFGFKFLVQGDFLLSASREDILSPCPWNNALREAVVDAFIDTIKNKHRRYLQNIWPQFIPNPPFANSFFAVAATKIHNAFKAEPLVLNYDGDLCKPADVVSVPREFRTDETDSRTPLLLCATTRRRYLSDSYDESCQLALESLGVRKMTTADFVQDLVSMVSREPRVFQSNSNQWHSILSLKLMSSLSSEDPRGVHRSQIRKLGLVPLSENRWVTPEDPSVFLPSQDHVLLNIQGVGLNLVNPEAASDNGRASLLRFLGIRTISNPQICDYIAYLHERGRSALDKFSTADLVSQVLFLFSSGWQNFKQQDFWFVNERETICPASTLYLQSSNSYAASHYLRHLEDAAARFLHPGYVGASEDLPGGKEAFVTWLIASMRLSKFIRVFDIRLATSAERAIKISRDFLNIVQHDIAPSWILMLRDNWRFYSDWLDPDDFEDLPVIVVMKFPPMQLKQRHQALIGQIGAITVKCLDGTRSPLNGTYLPLPRLLEDSVDGIPLMQVSDSENPHWKHLKCLGLGIDADLKFYMQCLEKLSESSRNGRGDPKTSRKVATYLDQIQARYNEDAELVKKSFREKCLIRVKPVRSVSGHRWVNAPLCLWEGPKCLRHLPVLKDIFPGNATLFREVLGVKDAVLADLLREAQFLENGDDVEHIKELLLEVERILDKNEPDRGNVLGEISKRAIFPIIQPTPNGVTTFGYHSLVSMDHRNSWFIADRKELFTSFEGKVPLLALKIEHIHELKKTFEKFGLNTFKLSTCAQSRPGAGTQSNFNLDHSSDLRTRRRFFLRLIPAIIPLETRRRVAKHLRGLEVYDARNLTQEWSLMLKDGRCVQGRPAVSNVVFSTKEDALQVHIADGYMNSTLTKPDLVRHLAIFCEIPDDRRHLLATALLEDENMVEGYFAESGIGPLDEKIESDEPIEDDFQFKADKSDEDTSHGLGDYAEQLVTGKRGNNLKRQVPAPGACLHCRGQNGNRPGLFGWGNRPAPGLIPPRINVISLDSLVAGANGLGQPTEPLLASIRIFGLSSGPGPNLISANPLNPSEGRINMDLQFRGQELFSKQLSQIMNQGYRPAEHWTSRHRSRAGHAVFHGVQERYAAFTVPDPSGSLTRTMMQGHPDLNQWLRAPPTWHFEVETTKEGLESAFYLTNAQVDRARLFSLSSPRSADPPVYSPSDVVVLVRYCNIESQQPSAAFFRDPWTMLMYGQVTIQADTLYKCGINAEAGV